MLSLRRTLCLAAICLLAPLAAHAQDPTHFMATVGGVQMTADKTLTDNIAQSKDHTILVEALTSTGLDDTLAGSGPYTLFAPTDAAFNKIDKDKLQLMLQPENKSQLLRTLNYHIVPSRMTSADIEKLAASNNGKASLRTIEGDTLTVEKKDGQWLLEDTSGNKASIQQSDVLQSNGVLFVIDTVMQPKA